MPREVVPSVQREWSPRAGFLSKFPLSHRRLERFPAVAAEGGMDLHADVGIRQRSARAPYAHFIRPGAEGINDGGADEQTNSENSK